MTARHLTLHVTFLAGTYSGAEWPPSPARLVQAIVAGQASTTAPGLAWVERQPAPVILAADEPPSVVRRDYVPLNATPDHESRAARDRIIRREVPPVCYAWPLVDAADEAEARALIVSASQVAALGAGQDMALVRGAVIEAAPVSGAAGRLWLPVVGPRSEVDVLLTVPAPGLMDELARRHAATAAGAAAMKAAGHWSPQGGHATSDGSGFATVAYRPSHLKPRSALVAYALVRPDGSAASWPAGEAVVVAGMLRHALIQCVQGQGDLGAFVSGHPGRDGDPARRLSVVPVPSTGHAHADGRLRRALLLARPEDAALLSQVLRCVPASGLPLIDADSGEVLAMAVPIAGVRGEPVLRQLLRPARTWASVQPVILPGRDSGEPRRTRKLLLRTLAHAGIDPGLVERLDFGPRGYLPQSIDYRDTRIKQRDSWALPAVHVRITFREPVAGPIVLGQGRNAGVGTMAPCANPE